MDFLLLVLIVSGYFSLRSEIRRLGRNFERTSWQPDDKPW